MPERKNFLILAIGFGIVSIVIGGITIWNMISSLPTP